MFYFNILNLFSPKELIKLKKQVQCPDFFDEFKYSHVWLTDKKNLLRIKHVYLNSTLLPFKKVLTRTIVSNLFFGTPSTGLYHKKIANITAYGIFYSLFIEFTLTLKQVYTRKTNEQSKTDLEEPPEFLSLLEYLNSLISILSIIIHSLNYTSSPLRINLEPVISSTLSNSLLSLSLELLQLYSKENKLYSFNKVLILLSVCIDSSFLPSECIDLPKKEYLSRIKYSTDFLQDTIELYNDKITLMSNKNNSGDIFTIGDFKSVEEIKDITNKKYDKGKNNALISKHSISKETLDFFDEKFFKVLEDVYCNIKYDTEYFYDILYIKETSEELTNKEVRLFKSKLINTANLILLKLIKENKTLLKDKLKDSKLINYFYNNIFKISNKQSLFYTKRVYEGLQELNTFDLYNYKVEGEDNIEKEDSIDNANHQDKLFSNILEDDRLIKKWIDYNLNVNRLNGLRILQKLVKRESFEGKNPLFYEHSMMDNVHGELELGFRFVDKIQYKYLMKVLKEEYRNKDYESQLKEVCFLGYIFKETYTKIGEDWISDVNNDTQIYESEYA